jgi:hypothetical protein
VTKQSAAGKTCDSQTMGNVKVEVIPAKRAEMIVESNALRQLAD